MEIVNKPILGSTAPPNAILTATKLSNFALKQTKYLSSNNRYLDVGCGNGFITSLIFNNFIEFYGIDVEQSRLDEFRKNIKFTGRKYLIEKISAESLPYEDNYFDFITSFEVLEHIPDHKKAIYEMIRVLKPGGIIVVSTPQVFFPFENHGIIFKNKIIEKKFPLLPYIRPLHRKYSLARVFSSRELDKLFTFSKTMQNIETSYISPQFERAATNQNSWENKLKFLRKILNFSEKVPIVRLFTGVSILKSYIKLGII